MTTAFQKLSAQRATQAERIADLEQQLQQKQAECEKWQTLANRYCLDHYLQHDGCTCRTCNQVRFANVKQATKQRGVLI